MVSVLQSPPKPEGALEWVRLSEFCRRTGTPPSTAAEWCIQNNLQFKTGYRAEKRGSRWWVEMPVAEVSTPELPQIDLECVRETIAESTQRALIDGYRLAADLLERELETRRRFQRIDLAPLAGKAAS